MSLAIWRKNTSVAKTAFYATVRFSETNQFNFQSYVKASSCQTSISSSFNGVIDSLQHDFLYSISVQSSNVDRSLTKAADAENKAL